MRDNIEISHTGVFTGACQRQSGSPLIFTAQLQRGGGGVARDSCLRPDGPVCRPCVAVSAAFRLNLDAGGATMTFS